jgi:hypothetical protein
MTLIPDLDSFVLTLSIHRYMILVQFVLIVCDNSISLRFQPEKRLNYIKYHILHLSYIRALFVDRLQYYVSLDMIFVIYK